MTEQTENRTEILEGLKTFLRIPSISTLSEHKPDIRRAAEFVRDELASAGLAAELIEGQGNPLVYGEWTGAPGKPTLLFYGHYDVQPPDPLEEWKSPPFEPEIRGDDLFARGASDDKGQTYILIKAVQRMMARDGRLPVNVKFLVEGEEESGGEHISAWVASRPARLAGVSAAVICDTEMFAPELPTLCVGLRGIVYAEIHVAGANHDLHSGVYGGAAPNPMQAMAEILCSLKDREGRIRIPGFYDRVREPGPKEREAWARLPFDEAEYTAKEMGARELVGEPGIPVLERLWARPTFEVHGIRGGFTGEGAKTVIPARAVAKVSLRLVADQRPDEVERQLKQAVREVCPRGVAAEAKIVHSAAPSLVDPENPFVRSAAAALEQVFDKPAVYIRSGGSIPIVGLFDEHLGIPSVLMGFGLPDDNLHAPNEKFHLPNFWRGIDAVVRFIELTGSGG
jgi:acetylornithine deacetylase/succinyl-diaminopimelate desuccinylase-like protein